jgi:3-oxoacyl-[acyl-carrier protein] reductase
MNNTNMTNKAAVITGGARGLGREITCVLHNSGYRVAINYLHSDGPAHELGEQFGNRALLFKADVGKYSEVSEMAECIKQHWGAVDVLVNNAGITMDALCIRQTEAEWDSIMQNNLKGAFNTTKAFAPLMNGGGHIVNISSYAGIKGKSGQSAYSGSKAAILGLTRTAAIELAEYNIRVNTVLPGYMPTAMGMLAGKALAQARGESLLHALCDPAEVARFISFLIETETITGQTFCLDSRII